MLKAAAIEPDVEVLLMNSTEAENDFFKSPVTHDLSAYKQQADLIVANRMMDDLKDVTSKVFTLDSFGVD
ncbi:MAG TPA: hypothetical protein PLR90_03490 [Methylophilus sp.]|nr:hypothetical protein [Methylophilus sp.]HQQ32959.1 hypothetical protein [Methylophilus sp.]